MSDDPHLPAAPEPSGPVEPIAPGSGLPSSTAAGLATLTLIGGFVFLVLDRKDALVRYYAVQGIVLGIILAVGRLTYEFGTYVFSQIWGIGWLFNLLLNLIFFVLLLVWLGFWVVATICAFNGKYWNAKQFWTLCLRYYSKFR